MKTAPFPRRRSTTAAPDRLHDGREDSTRINQDASVYASLLDSGKSVELELQPGRHAWVQLISGELDVNGTQAGEGRRRRDQR